MSGGPSAGIVDVVFCCDTTGSMSSYLENTKKTIETIMTRIYEKCRPEEVSTRFGFVAYRDHPPQDHTYVTRMYDLNTYDKTLQFIRQQKAGGGGDYPEAVLDGLLVSAKKISWRNSYTTPILRYIFHIADAPPHGKEFYEADLKPASSYPGPSLDEVSEWINRREIHYRLIKIRGGLEKMAGVFAGSFGNFEQTPL